MAAAASASASAVAPAPPAAATAPSSGTVSWSDATEEEQSNANVEAKSKSAVAEAKQTNGKEPNKSDINNTKTDDGSEFEISDFIKTRDGTLKPIMMAQELHMPFCHDWEKGMFCSREKLRKNSCSFLHPVIFVYKRADSNKSIFKPCGYDLDCSKRSDDQHLKEYVHMSTKDRIQMYQRYKDRIGYSTTSQRNIFKKRGTPKHASSSYHAKHKSYDKDDIRAHAKAVPSTKSAQSKSEEPKAGQRTNTVQLTNPAHPVAPVASSDSISPMSFLSAGVSGVLETAKQNAVTQNRLDAREKQIRLQEARLMEIMAMAMLKMNPNPAYGVPSFSATGSFPQPPYHQNPNPQQYVVPAHSFPNTTAAGPSFAGVSGQQPYASAAYGFSSVPASIPGYAQQAYDVVTTPRAAPLPSMYPHSFPDSGAK